MGPLPHRLCVLIFGLFSLAGSPPALANSLHLGVLAHDVPDLWSHNNREDGIDLNLEWTPRWPAWSPGTGTVGSHLGLNLNSAGDTSYLYGGLNWRLGQSKGWYGRIGLGGALHNGERRFVNNDRKALGSRLLFHIPLEVGYQWSKYSVSLYFSHISNAYTQDENEGMDTLGLRVGWVY